MAKMKLLPIEFEEAAVQAQILQQEMNVRAAPRVAELMDALNGLINAARSGNPNAKAALQAFTAVLDGARRAGGSIVIPKIQ